jgi:hypothetical protein
MLLAKPQDGIVEATSQANPKWRSRLTRLARARRHPRDTKLTQHRERARVSEHVVLTQRDWQCLLPVSTF